MIYGGVLDGVNLWCLAMVTNDWWPWCLQMVAYPVLSACMRHNVTFTMWGTNYKQLLDEVFVISRIIKVEVSAIAKLKGSCVICEPSIKYHSAVMLSIGQLSIAMSVDCWSTCQSICWPTLDWYGSQCIGQHIGWHVNTISRSVSRHISILSVDYCLTHQPTCWLRVRWQMSAERSTRVSQYVHRYGDCELADIPAEISIEYPPVVSTNTRLRGTQITQDPLKDEADNTCRNLDYFGYHKNWFQGCAPRKTEGSPML